MTADPRGAQEAVEAPVPRQRDAGVMGYVAELQQFDDSIIAIAGDEPQPEAERNPDPAPARDARPIPEQRPAARRDAAEPRRVSGSRRGAAGHGSPARRAASAVPQKQGRPPWSRTEVGLAVAFILVAAVAIVGGAYAVVAANRPPTGDVRLPLPSVEAAGEQAPPALVEPLPEVPRAPGAGPSPTVAPEGGAAPSTAESAGPVATPEGSVAPPPAADLVASYTREANTGLLGLTGYRGKVSVANRGQGAADGWTVTLSLPAGQRVDSVAGASAEQSGQLVTFTPLEGQAEVAPGGSVSFTFEVPGLLAGEPTGCAINGRPCE